MLTALLFMALLGRIDTAMGQANLLQVSQVQQIINTSVGGPSLTQTVNVTSVAGPLTYTIAPSSNSNWLSVSTTTGTTPGSFTLTAAPGSLPVGTYPGLITLNAPGANPVSINLQLNVGNSSALTVSAQNLSFAAQVGSANTSIQTVAVSSATNNIQFTAAIVYGQPTLPAWLTVAPTTGNTPATLQLFASPGTLPAGTYTATINLTNAQSVPVPIYVTFVVSAQATITVSQPSIQFYYQVGQAAPAQASLSITSGTGSIPATISSATSTCTGSNWLVVTPIGQVSTPANLSVGASIIGFTQPVTCNGSITINAPGASNPSVTIPVTLTVSTTPLLIITPSAPSAFTYQAGGAFPVSQNLAISSSSSPLQFTTASSQPWLTVTSNGTTALNSVLTISISPTALSTMNPGTYSGMVTVTAPAAANSPVNIPVTLTISSSTLFTVTPPFVNLNYQIGQQAPTATGITIGSTGVPMNFTIGLSGTTTTQFVTVNGAASTSGTTPATVSIGASPLPTTAGVFQNTLVVSNPASVTTATQNVPVQLTVSNTALLNASPQTLSFTIPIGQSNTIVPQTVSFSSTDPNGPLSFTVSSPVPWLTPVLSNGTQVGSTPAVLNVGIAPYIYSPPSVAGTYTSSILVTATTTTGQSQTLNIPVMLTVTSGLSLTATPATLSFTQAASAAAPANQTLTLAVTGPNSGTLPFSATAPTTNGGAWLTVTPGSGTAPGLVTVSITPAASSLAPGTYNGTVVLTSVTAANPNGMVVIPVVLTITAAPTITASPIGVTLTAGVGGVNPTAPLAISAMNSSVPVAFSAAVAPGANWLSVTPNSASTPSTLTVTANLTGLVAGTYNGNIVITPVGSASLTVAVTLTVSPQTVPAFMQLSNGASNATGAISPGEIVSLYGLGLGPASPAGVVLTPGGLVATTVAGVTVTFNGTPAPLTYVSASQINCVVPYEIAGATSAQVQVSYNGVTSVASAVNVVPAFPGIFTYPTSGVAVIQKADFSLVSATNPATRGSTIIIYATGEGQTNPAGVTGSVGSGTNLKNPVAPVTVTIGGQPATVAYAGTAPGNVSGLLQLNVIVPTAAATGSQPLTITIGNATSQGNVSLSLQ